MPTKMSPSSRCAPIMLPPVFLMYAFRYTLGRMSYAVGEVADTLIDRRDILRPDWRAQIARDITDALDEDRAGMATDRAQWERVRAAMEASDE